MVAPAGLTRTPEHTANATTTRLYTCRHEHPIRDTL